MESKRGFWCSTCRYGSTTAKPWTKCPQCGSEGSLTTCPFTPGKREKGMGSGQPSGKTQAKLRGRPSTGKPQEKILRKLEARKKFCAAHGTHKGKHLHTIPGSMKKGGGW